MFVPTRSTSVSLSTAIVGLVLLPLLGTVVAQEPVQATARAQGGAGEEKAKSFFDEALDHIVGGKVDFNLRLRAEIVEQDTFDASQAYTGRLRLGYGSKPFHGFSFYTDFEAIGTADRDLYNAAGVYGDPDNAVVADIEDEELNQAYLDYKSEYAGARIARQRITLDDHRFVGNVGWRQNEQTFDAYTLSSEFLPDTFLFYSYVDEVKRIFGPDANRDFDSDSHLINASYAGLPAVGKVVVFGYLLDFDNSAANSSNSVGARLQGERDFCEDFTAGWVLSYAFQEDAADNATDYKANYYFVEATLGKKGVGTAGVGYEVLGSDDGAFGFRTPLATLHAFNGWADAFLVTPAAGLQDLYVSAATTLPWQAIKLKGVFHWFWGDDDSSSFGNEFDAAVSKAINEHVSILAKVAFFDGDAGMTDIQKYWLQTEVTF